MNQQTEAAGEIRYDLRAGRPRITKWITGFLIVIEAVTVVRYATDVCSTRKLNTVVVDQRGISFPSRRFIPWSKVEAVHRKK